MTHIPLRLNFLGQHELVDLLAAAYADTARRGAPMRTAVEALETIREATAGGDAAHALLTLDAQIGDAYRTALQPPLIALRERLQFSLIQAIGHQVRPDNEAGWQRWLVIFTTLLVNSQTSFLRILRLLQLPSRAPALSDTLLPQELCHFADLAWQRRWPELYDPIVAWCPAVKDRLLQARLECMAGQIQLFHFDRLRKAQTHFNRACKLAPEDIEIFGAMGNWHEYWGESQRAKAIFYQQIARAPRSADGFCDLGDVLLLEGDVSGAESQYQQAIQNAPGDVRGHEKLIELYSRPELYPVRKDTIADLRKRMLLIEPNRCATLAADEAKQHLQNERFGEARAAYDLCLNLEPDRLDARCGQGQCDAREAARLPPGDPERDILYAAARATYQRIIADEPQAREGYWELSLLDEALGDVDAALCSCAKTTACHPDWIVTSLVRAGDLKRGKAYYAEAEADLLKALDTDSGNRQALATLAILADDRLYKEKNKAAAVRLYNAVRDGWGEIAPYIYENRIGNLLYYEGDYASAIQHYRAATKMRDSDPILFENLATSLVQLVGGNRAENLTEAVIALQRAFSLDPSYSDYGRKLADAEAELDLHLRYGSAFLVWTPACSWISVPVAPATVPLITDASRSALNEATQRETLLMRSRVELRFGLKIPSFNFTGKNAEGLSAGTFRVVIDGEDDGWTGRIDDQALNPVAALSASLESRLADCIDRLATYDTVGPALNESDEPAAREIGANIGVLVPFTHCVRALAGEKRLSRSALDTLAVNFVAAHGGGQLLTRVGTPSPTPPSAQAPDLSLKFGMTSDRHAAMRDNIDASLRTLLFESTGVLLPAIHLVTDPAQPGGSVAFIVDQDEVWSGAIPADPDAGVTLVSNAIAKILHQRATQFITLQLVEHYLTRVAEQRPILDEAARAFVPVNDIMARLRNHVAAGGSIRNLPPLLAHMVEQATSLRGTTTDSRTIRSLE